MSHRLARGEEGHQEVVKRGTQTRRRGDAGAETAIAFFISVVSALLIDLLTPRRWWLAR